MRIQYTNNTNQISNSYLNVKVIKILLKLAATVALSTSLSAFSTSAHAEIQLIFGTYAADKPTASIKKVRPVLSELEKHLTGLLGEEVKIQTQVSTNYEKGIDDLVQGRVDFAKFGPASYIFAKEQNSDIEILAMESVKGKKTFKGIICVATDSPISSLEDLKGRTFAFGNKLSTIGRYLSQKELVDAGVTAADLKSYSYLGRHDRVGTAVGSGEFEAGALKSSTFKKLVEKGVKIRGLASFDNVTKPWIARSGMSEKVSNALRQAFLMIDNPEVLKKIKKTGFVEGNDADYEPIRKAIKASSEFDVVVSN